MLAQLLITLMIMRVVTISVLDLEGEKTDNH
jgi:hypothetical protein